MRFTINQKILLLFSFFMLLLVAVGSAAFYHGLRSVLINNVRAELIAAAIEKESTLTDWFTVRTRDVERLAASADVQRAVADLTSGDPARIETGRVALLKEFNERIVDENDSASYILLDYTTARVIVSTRSDLNNVDWARQAIYFNGRNGTYLQTPARLAPAMPPELMIAAPVSLGQGQPVAVVVALFPTTVLEGIITRRGALRQSDESILFNSASQYVTLPRLDGSDITLLESVDLSPAVRTCLAGKSGFEASRDYRGVAVFKSYRWIPNYGLCLVSKVDESEALAPIAQLVPLILIGAAIMHAVGVVVAGFLARAITRPVIALTEGAAHLSAGNRDVRLTINTGDELEQLANAFNSMAAALAGHERQLRDYAAQLEVMVDTRTAELHASEALGRAVMENSPVGISVRNSAGDLIYWNPAWLSIYGTSDAELHELKSQLQTSSRARQILRSELAQDVHYIQSEGGMLFIPEIAIEIPGQSVPRWIAEYSYAIPNLHGKIDRVVTLTEDITDRKERQQEMEKLLAFSAAVRAAETRLEMEETVLTQVCQLLGVENAGIILRDPADYNIIRGRGCGAWSAWADSVCQPADTGIAGEVLRTGQMYVTDDVYSDPRLVGNNLGDVSALSLAPLVVHNAVTGSIVIGAKSPFSESQLRLFRAMSDLAANAFYRLSLSELTERRLQWLTAIRAIDQSIMGSIDLRITFNVLLDRTVNQLSLDAAGILLLRQSNRLEYAAWRGFREVKPAQVSMRLGDLQAGRAALEQRTIIVPDYNAALGWKSDVMEREGLRGYCAVPLVTKGQVKGVLEVFSKSPLNVDAEWVEFLESLAGLAAISIENATLIETIQRTNTELAVAYDSTLLGWSQTIEMRERHKQGHARRMADLTLDMARMLGVDERDFPHIYRGVLLHDIGTLSIPEEILHKDGPLTPEERALLETHTEHAYRIIQSVEYLRPALDIPYAHHERWDGSGYPRGLKGEQIPLAARIFAVVEVWDALTHDRPHRKALTEAQALAYIREQSGRHFDPRVVEAFLQLMGKR
ncbi:MAG: HD domain-containing phosphohydrolase [Anaerolineales bacterium]